MDLKTVIRAFWDRIAAWALIGVGAVVLLVGWLGVRGTPYVEEQVPYVISAGFTGLALIGIGATLWLSADLRDEWQRLRALEEGVTALLATDRSTDQEATAQSNGIAGPPRRSVKQ
ncbi:MAG: hypothetical protein ACYDH6_18630 [Acidimicrobiales bacterium]